MWSTTERWNRRRGSRPSCSCGNGLAAGFAGAAANISLNVAKGLATYGVDSVTASAANAGVGLPELYGLGSLGGGELSLGAGAAEGAVPLVYGPSAGGELAATAERLGGETLTSLPKLRSWDGRGSARRHWTRQRVLAVVYQNSIAWHSGRNCTRREGLG
jgi:hypothetical protein